jgi:hypothetical protein
MIWGRLGHSRVLGVLKNPSYAGIYVFGRYQYRREISVDGEVHKRMMRLPCPTGVSACSNTTKDTSLWTSSLRIESGCK